MIKRLLILDGVLAAARFRDDGSLVDGLGVVPESELATLVQFTHEYRRMVQGNADQLSMFSGMKGWTPPRAWVVRGASLSICCVGNLVCILDNAEVSLNEVITEMTEVSRW